MKILKYLLVVIFFAASSAAMATSAGGGDKTDTIKVKTSAVCDMCKKTIETALAFEKGVKSSDLHVDSKVVTVVYNPKKTSPEEIRTAIANSGYDADRVPADKKAYDNLHPCCKKDAH